MSVFFFVLGLIFGSFGSVLVTRVPCGESICGRSGCPKCQKTLTPLELIPIVSFFILRGRCRGCKVPIGWIYPTIEVLSGIIFLYAYVLHGEVLLAILLSLCLWLMLLIAVIDMHTQTISDLLSIPLLILAIVYSFLLGQLEIAGMMIGVAFFGSQWLLSRGKWLGSGDVVLAAGIGALVGSWEHMVACLFLTYVIGGAISSVLLLSHVIKRGQYVAFAPFLVIGAVVSIVFEARIDQFVSLYFGI